MLTPGVFWCTDQATSLRARPDIVVATPGRLIDHLHNTQSFALESVEVLTLSTFYASV
jgi:superfamily II DNA/RNA helicase